MILLEVYFLQKLVNMFLGEGIDARRQPMSGAIVGFPHDLVVDVLGGSTVEAKARANGEGFKTIQRLPQHYFRHLETSFSWRINYKPSQLISDVLY